MHHLFMYTYNVLMLYNCVNTKIVHLLVNYYKAVILLFNSIRNSDIIKRQKNLNDGSL
jgi:hypothetical protein